MKVSTGSEAALLMGLFGVGKSTIAAEMAGVLEVAGAPYAALDLDWLMWCNVGDGTRRSAHAMMLRNLDAVLSNYRGAGVRYFVLAGSIYDHDELTSLAATLAMPLRTVELVVPFATIAERLASDPTAGRRDDLAESAEWIAKGVGTGFADRMLTNDGPVREVAHAVLHWLEWPTGPCAC